MSSFLLPFRQTVSRIDIYLFSSIVRNRKEASQWELLQEHPTVVCPLLSYLNQREKKCEYLAVDIFRKSA